MGKYVEELKKGNETLSRKNEELKLENERLRSELSKIKMSLKATNIVVKRLEAKIEEHENWVTPVNPLHHILRELGKFGHGGGVFQ